VRNHKLLQAVRGTSRPPWRVYNGCRLVSQPLSHDDANPSLRPLAKPHPWHGVSIGAGAPEIVTVFIEIVPTDTVKYEIDKATGYLKIDRPQRFSNVSPTPYGFVPQTYCGPRVAQLAAAHTGRAQLAGDGDPLDICVITEKTIAHGNLLLEAIPIGGLRMLDKNEVDDKILAVLKGDAAYGNWRDIGDCPDAFVQRIKHYFLTYKQSPQAAEPTCEITDIYDRGVAHDVIRRSQADYEEKFVKK